MCICMNAWMPVCIYICGHTYIMYIYVYFFDFVMLTSLLQLAACDFDIPL